MWEGKSSGKRQRTLGVLLRKVVRRAYTFGTLGQSTELVSGAFRSVLGEGVG